MNKTILFFKSFFLLIILILILHANEITANYNMCNRVIVDATYYSRGKLHNGIPLHINGQLESITLGKIDKYMFMKEISIAERGTNNIVQDLYYNTDEPGRYNFDKVCGERSGYCEYNTDWNVPLPSGVPVPGDYDILIHVIFSPMKCGLFSCHKGDETCECNYRYPVYIDNSVATGRRSVDGNRKGLKQ